MATSVWTFADVIFTRSPVVSLNALGALTPKSPASCCVPMTCTLSSASVPGAALPDAVNLKGRRKAPMALFFKFTIRILSVPSTLVWKSSIVCGSPTEATSQRPANFNFAVKMPTFEIV